MSYQEQVFFNVPLERLEPIFKNWIREVQREAKQPHQSTDETDLLTPKETAKLLKISLPTLFRWKKKEKVKCYGIGGKRYYKYSELIQVLTSSNTTD